MVRRHAFPPRSQQRPQRVRLQFDRKTEPIDLIEYYGTCMLCGTVRTMFRHRYTREFAWAEYVYPDGYIAPAGTKWDPEMIRDEYDRRFPVKGKVKFVNR